MSQVVVRVELIQGILQLTYSDPSDPLVDERVVRIRIQGNPALTNLTQAFSDAVVSYCIEGNMNLEDVSKADLNQLFRDLLFEDSDPV